MNLKKIALSLTASSLLFGSTFSALGQASDDESYAYLIPILDLVLNSTSTCTTSEVELLTILSASDDGGFREGNPPENAIDNNPLTRWAHNNGEDFSNTEAIITFKLGATATVTDLSVSWLNSDDRNSFFSIDTSTDNITWTSVFPNGITEITDIDGEFKTHDVIDTNANYVRIIGDGNDQNNFTSINEVQINGCVGLLPDSSSSEETPDPTEETPDPTEETPDEPTDPDGTTVAFGTGVTITTFDTTSTGIPTDVSAFGLNPSLQPWQNFDLSVWGLDSPSIRDINEEVTGAAPRGVRIDDFEFIALQEGPSNEDYESALALYEGTNGEAQSSEPYFFTGDDGGMVFKSPVDGARTSSNTSFPRSELREYVRGGVTRRENASGTGTESISTSGANENNWVLGYQPNNLVFDDNGRDANIQNVGGRNGRLAASLKVNRVTVTGADDDVGVTIIGQIHAENDEPIRLYYRKLPQHDLGSVYVVHEIRRARDEDEPNDGRFGRDFPDIDLVGESSDSARAEEVANGIALDELFSYEIINEGELLIVNLYRGDLNTSIIASTTINMSTIVNQRDDAEGDPAGSGYDRIDEWMYFKAGAYTQNNTGDTTGFGEDLDGDGVGDEADFDLVTFYELSVSHDSNEPQ